MEDMVAIKWERPGSRHHGVVHYVHQDIVKDVPDQPGKVMVLWPKKGKKEPEVWDGYKVDVDEPACPPSKYTIATVLDNSCMYHA